MNTLDKITNPITYTTAHIVAFIVTLRQGNKTQKYRTIIRGLLPEANQQHKDHKDTTNFVLNRWDGIANDEIRTISKLLKRGIKLSEWGWLIAIGSGLLLITTGNIAISLANKLLPDGGLPKVLTIEPEILDCVKENNCIIIFDLVNVDDLYSPDFEAGKLTVKFTTNSTPDDILSIRNQGTNPNEIGIDEKNVTYGGTIIGIFEGGTETQPLEITFNPNAKREIIQTLLQQITYSNSSKNPTIGQRTLEFQLTDGDGGISNTLTTTINIIITTATAVTASTATTTVTATRRGSYRWSKSK